MTAEGSAPLTEAMLTAAWRLAQDGWPPVPPGWPQVPPSLEQIAEHERQRMERPAPAVPDTDHEEAA